MDYKMIIISRTVTKRIAWMARYTTTGNLIKVYRNAISILANWIIKSLKLMYVFKLWSWSLITIIYLYSLFHLYFFLQNKIFLFNYVWRHFDLFLPFYDIARMAWIGCCCQKRQSVDDSWVLWWLTDLMVIHLLSQMFTTPTHRFHQTRILKLITM